VKLVIRPKLPLCGRIVPPGDKSITHRAVLLGLVAGEAVRITAPNPGADCASTLDCARALGASVEIEAGAWTIRGGRLHEPERVLDCGNSGTALRLLSGVVASHPFECVLSGDASLNRRPVDRVVKPLREMGATLSGRDQDRLPPLVIRGGPLRAIHHRLGVASAQVASAILFAALEARGTTEIEIPGPARDHTERMLRAAGVAVEERPAGAGGRVVRLEGPASVRGGEIRVPGDLSAAAFFLAAAAACPGAEIVAEHVGLNPSRTGFLDALEAMGAEVERLNPRDEMGEPVGDVRVRGPERLRAFDVPAEWVPRMIDEAPAWAIVASAASGTSRLSGAAELRVKESDRIALLARNLARLGVAAEERPDGIAIEGGAARGGEIEAADDHRIAMAFAVIGARANGPVTIDDGTNIATSYPGFVRDFAALGGRIESVEGGGEGR
jgi:3-phosphoshikimate 1-carboxyvinyltransferase